MENQKTKEQEKRFIAWTLARDDDWWEEGHGHFSIWDFRVIQEFFKEEISNALNQQREEIEKKNLEFMEACEPDCDEVRHARHEGSWNHYWKMDEFLTKLEGK